MKYSPEEIAQAIYEAEEACRGAFDATPDYIRLLIPIYNPEFRTRDEILEAQTARFQRVVKRPGAMKTIPGQWYRAR